MSRPAEFNGVKDETEFEDVDGAQWVEEYDGKVLHHMQLSESRIAADKEVDVQLTNNYLLHGSTICKDRAEKILAINAAVRSDGDGTFAGISLDTWAYRLSVISGSQYMSHFFKFGLRLSIRDIGDLKLKGI